MLRISTIIILLFCLIEMHAQPGLWTWVNGDTIMNLPPHYGTQGIPDPLNHPTGTHSSAYWTDKQGNFWFFDTQYGSAASSNDLWKYNPVTNMWTWMKGPGVVNNPGNYGTQGVTTSSNLPPSRRLGIASWTDTTGNFWMYGGYSWTSPYKTFNDLWKFDVSSNNWTWINGSNIPNQPPVYGTRGIASPLNSPGARDGIMCTWTDDLNNLWLFAGTNKDGDKYNDLWKYSIASNQWTWMKGSNTLNPPGFYGVKGVEDSLNNPSGRNAYAKWKDDDGNFWLFGGCRYGSGVKYLNDLWKYNITTNNWTWMKGPNDVPFDIGNTGPLCAVGPDFNPINRNETSSCWKDNNGDLWMFGGRAQNALYAPYELWLNDVWRYRPSTNEWTLMWQDSYNSHGNFGTKGVASPSNKPLGTSGAVSWYDPGSNSVYIFGGLQFRVIGSGFSRSEMWKYVLDTTCSVIPLPIELLSFQSLCSGKDILLKWITASETNNSYFTVERSKDGIEFIPVETILGAGNSSVSLQYEYVDKNKTGKEVFYYRLKQTDFDGKFSYSEIIISKCSGKDFTVRLMPNPSSSFINIEFSEIIKGNVNYKIYDVVGKEVLSQNEIPDRSVQNFTINTASLSSGVYFVVIKYNENQQVERIVIDRN